MSTLLRLLLALLLLAFASATPRTALQPASPWTREGVEPSRPAGVGGVAVGQSGAPRPTAQPSAMPSPTRGIGPRATAGPRPVSPSAPARTAAPTEKASAATVSQSPRSWHYAIASVYGNGDGYLYGHLACGGRLLPGSMVVAHRTLPCGTKVQFRYGGRTVTATVMDRGPYVRGRTWDLGVGVARALRFPGLGTVGWRAVK